MAQPAAAAARGGVVRKDDATPLPLKQVAVKANVEGYVLDLVARMLYENNAEDPAEIIFRMPIEQSQAVVAMTAVVDGRRIKATIREKKQANEMYDDAIASGSTAALGEKDTDDIFSISLGNLRVGGEAEVELHFVDELPIDAEGNVRFSLPTTLKPRYTPAGSKDVLAPVVGESNQVKHGTFSGVQQFELKVLEAHGVSAVTSPTHTINVLHNSVVRVTIAEGESLEKDLIILITPKEPYQPKAIVEVGIPVANDKEMGFMASPVVMVSFFPKIPEADVNCELIFLVDRSGSMAGSFIHSARETLVLFLKSLPEGSYFNIIGFGSGYESLFPSSVPYTQENLDKATTHAQNIAADLGGTEILQPLRYIFTECPHMKGLSRQIFLLTDGSVSNARVCIEEVRNNAHKARCFTFGIGAGASSFLVNGIAEAGRGTAEFVKGDERLQPKVVRSLKHALQPAVLDVSVSFNVTQEVEVTQVPTSLPPLYDGQKLLVYGLLRPKFKQFTSKEISGHIVLRGSLLGKDIVHQVPFSASLLQVLQEKLLPAHHLAAKNLIKEMETSSKPKQEIVDLSIEASIISRETAFIAIEESSDQVVGVMRTYDVLMEATVPNFSAMLTQLCDRGDKLEDVCLQSELNSAAVLFQKSSKSVKRSGGLLSSFGNALGSAASTVSGWFGQKKEVQSAASVQVVSDSCEEEDSERVYSKVHESEKMEHCHLCMDESEGLATRGDEPIDLAVIKDGMPYLPKPVPASIPEPKPSIQSSNPSVVVALQQANGSWLLSDNLLVLLGLDRSCVEAACPPGCEVLVWATVLTLTLLNVRYGKEQDELELVTKKAKFWLGNQPLPNEVTLESLYAAAENLLK